MGASHSKYPRGDSSIHLIWNEEHLVTISILELENAFPRLRRQMAFSRSFKPKGDAATRHPVYRNRVQGPVFDLAPHQDTLLWIPVDQRDDEEYNAKQASPMRFGGSETVRIVLKTLLGCAPNMNTMNNFQDSIEGVLANAFTGLHRDEKFSEDDLGERDMARYLNLLESFVEISAVLECLDAGLNTRKDIEHSYLKYRKYIKHNVEEGEQSLRFLRIADVLQYSRMMQDFIFPVLSAFETLFKRWHMSAHKLTFSQFGERQWNLSRRLCDFLEREHAEFQKRKKQREQFILREYAADIEEGFNSIYDEAISPMLITLSSQALVKLLETSPLTVDPSQSINKDVTSLTRYQDHDHVVIQLRVFRNPPKHHLSLSMDDRNLTPSHTPIPSRRPSPMPEVDYFLGGHTNQPFNNRTTANNLNINPRHHLNRNHTYHGNGFDDHHTPHGLKDRDVYLDDLPRFKDNERYLRSRARDEMMLGDPRNGELLPMEMHNVTVRTMEQAIKEEKKRVYTMPWVGGSVNGTKLIGYGGEGYRG